MSDSKTFSALKKLASKQRQMSREQKVLILMTLIPDGLMIRVSSLSERGSSIYTSEILTWKKLEEYANPEDVLNVVVNGAIDYVRKTEKENFGKYGAGEPESPGGCYASRPDVPVWERGVGNPGI